ncbi:MAG TPA: UDP-N-acetylmuramoyl-tripeptide--D-alanyl-D-alanine ligase [Bryobacteraceae bacterium]
MHLSLAQVQTATGAESCASAPEACEIRGWSIDSRTTAAGDLFIAISGEHFDGHKFLNDAFARGAVAALVSETVEPCSRPILKTRDTVQALGQLARWARRNWGRPVVAVTGSAGKTGTKDIVAEFLAVKFCVGKTIGNLNNHIGLPLSLLRVADDAEIAVLEMGMNHAGEIRNLAAIAEPEIGVVTNVGYAHIEAFDSIDGIAAAKRELIESLPDSGIAVLNADDERVARFRQAHRGRSVTYGFSETADVRATELELRADGASFSADGVRFRTSLSGRHAVSNILAGLAVAGVYEIDFSSLTDAVARLVPGSMRGERSEWRGITILNDCYNSNPEAARSMIEVLRNQPAQRRIAVLGEMRELGKSAEKLHRELGAYAANAGIDALIGIGGMSRALVEEAAKTIRNAFFFESPEEAGTFLLEFTRPQDAILFKGSRGSHVERALARMEVS